MTDLKELSGIKYIRETRLSREIIREQRPTIESCPGFKEYLEAEKITLPRLEGSSRKNIWQILQDRRSHRKFSTNAISLEQLSLLLWASQGITAQAGDYFFRTAPSGGALYPIETYLGINNIKDVKPGLYHFNALQFILEKIYSTSPGKLIDQAAFGQRFLSDCNVVFIWSAIFRRNMSRYGNRGLRYILMDVAHICQNLLLAAEDLNLGACPVAAFNDDEMNDLLDLNDDEESVLYLAAVGKK